MPAVAYIPTPARPLPVMELPVQFTVTKPSRCHLVDTPWLPQKGSPLFFAHYHASTDLLRHWSGCDCLCRHDMPPEIQRFTVRSLEHFLQVPKSHRCIVCSRQLRI